MNSLDALTVVTAVTGSCAVALVGWFRGTRDPRRSQSDVPTSKTWRSALTAVVVLGAMAAAVAAPMISVLWAGVALNFLLGRRESIPFSTYPMFSTPTNKAWALSFEDSDGESIAIGQIGLAPNILRKRFETELQVARARGIDDIVAIRRSAAAVVAGVLEQHRPRGGPWAERPITIVLIEYILESGRLLRVRIPIMETPPP
jgi:hypothetical protein